MKKMFCFFAVLALIAGWTLAAVQTESSTEDSVQALQESEEVLDQICEGTLFLTPSETSLTQELAPMACLERRICVGDCKEFWSLGYFTWAEYQNCLASCQNLC